MMRIAAVQCAAIPDDVARVCASVRARVAWADATGIDLLLFPEAWLTGHAWEPETITRRADAAAAAIDALCRAVAGARATLVIGAFVREAGRVFNRALVIAGGGVVGHYDKAHPNEPGVTAGKAFPTFAAGRGRFGINICADANHPDAAQRIAEQRAAAILYPLSNMLPVATAARWRARSVDNLVARARQTGCWVAAADVTGTAGDLISFGCTAIVAPDGKLVARVSEGEEGVAHCAIG
ncbi:acyltransferase [Sphingomonas ginsenosidimutans]|jgi:predicted amidohydrolase|uniref:Acyltransferase n=1 Tax=Sphingomonas ginsenosidimutans TaxID=862134 RepID=A0A2A4HW61_9SPHN|nr:carbon-nitrogen hydrolase family protein [Sphingomonas ginsenosidimutans]PCG07918.1 acyltransferase [Sphingomonas ginsenosidimutans]